ncbi:MAG: ATP-binding cassette domain-containing protein, partial [Polyangiaceae bacterium]
MLDVAELSVTYGAIRALRGVSLSIAQGQVVALIGSNGAGKTSTLRAVSGMVRPSEGRVVFRGEDTTQLRSHVLVQRGM